MKISTVRNRFTEEDLINVDIEGVEDEMRCDIEINGGAVVKG